MAIIGASANPSKFGNKAVRAYQHQGWVVFPVNPNHDTIEGLPAYKSILDIEQPISRVSIYVPPEIGMNVISEVALKKPQQVYLNPGSESAALVAKASELGLHTVQACSIVAINENPKDY